MTEEDKRNIAVGKAYLRWYAAAKGYRNVNADVAPEAIMHDAGSVLYDARINHKSGEK